MSEKMTEVEMAPARFGMIIVGDEILSGRRQDKHFPHMLELMSARGLSLSWLRVLPDDRALLTQALRESFASQEIVFCCGGIGATPDDHTRQAAAAALDLPLVLHPEAEREITLRCAEMAATGQGSADMALPENQRRLQMGTFAAGAEIVPNPYNRIPGFHINRHTFVPGFPVMAWPMLAWTLDNRYPELHHPVLQDEQSFIAFDIPESRITPTLEEIEQRWPKVKAFSLPSMGEDRRARHIELGVKGPNEFLPDALAFLRQEAQALGATLEPTISRAGNPVI